MSLLFEALRELESEHAEIGSLPSSEAAEYLRCAERKVPSKWDTTQAEPNDEGLRPPAESAAHPSTIEFPQPASNSSPASPADSHSDIAEHSADAAEAPLRLPSGVRRVVAVLRVALPFVERVLPLLDGDSGTTASSHPTSLQPASAAAPPVPADVARIEDSIAEFKTQYRTLREQVVEQDASLKRVEDRLGMVREATDRSTREQQELIENLKGVGKKVNVVAMVALGLLGVSIAIDIVLCLHVH